MGKAGEHQVDGAAVALGHAYGGGSQFFSMWVVRPPREDGAAAGGRNPKIAQR